MSKKWQTIEYKQEHPIAKNKHLSAICVTKENAALLAKETGAFTVLNPSDPTSIETGVLLYRRLPVWIINLNPVRKKNRYLFEPDTEFNRYFRLSVLTKH